MSKLYETYKDIYLEVYKHGVSDGLLGGVNPYYEADKYTGQFSQIYNEGFEFGMSLWHKQKEMKNDE
tara:strand:- start:1352 stop:1552 length:201 start_codon:yes stop_codon:yes gene_type:complete